MVQVVALVCRSVACLPSTWSALRCGTRAVLDTASDGDFLADFRLSAGPLPLVETVVVRDAAFVAPSVSGWPFAAYDAAFRPATTTAAAAITGRMRFLVMVLVMVLVMACMNPPI